MYFITHPTCNLHEMGAQHPESPARLDAIKQQLVADNLWDKLIHLTPQKATRDCLALAHSTSMIDRIFHQSPQQGYAILDADTQMNTHSLDAALYAAGAGQLALDKLFNSETQQAFCSVRPPGHHAEAHQSMGFCLFNSIAITALSAIKQYYLKRVAIVDFDVHHGNGTENIISGNHQTLLISTFQHPLYPGSGIPPSADNIMNYPLDAGTGSNAIRLLWQTQLIPQLRNYQPELILVSAGFDAHRQDPLANLEFNDDDYAFFARELKAVAKEQCRGRMISFLEGGYHLDALGRSCSQYIQALLNTQKLNS